MDGSVSDPTLAVDQKKKKLLINTLKGSTSKDPR